jgi:hypothetical protein
MIRNMMRAAHGCAVALSRKERHFKEPARLGVLVLLFFACAAWSERTDLLLQNSDLAFVPNAELWGEVFEPLKDKSRFADFTLDKELETIVWSNGADFSPEFLYQKLCPN